MKKKLSELGIALLIVLPFIFYEYVFAWVRWYEGKTSFKGFASLLMNLKKVKGISNLLNDLGGFYNFVVFVFYMIIVFSVYFIVGYFNDKRKKERV